MASDGNGRNGAYSEAILSHLSQQDLSIETFFKRVRNSLSSSTNGKQISWEHTSLMGDYFFNHSRATTGSVTAYSEDVLADGAYLPRGPLRDIISGLKSYVWDQQNTAMHSLSPQRVETAGKDDCFILGRNIYQASCGGSFAVVSFVEGLGQSLLSYSEFARLHLFNGILYEIYFDSRGLKRKRAKADKLNEVFALEETPLFSDSFEFIRKALQPYLAELFYVPGSKSEICLDVVFGKSGDLPAVIRVCFEGQNILYNRAGDGYFDVSTELTGHTESRITLRAKISAALTDDHSLGRIHRCKTS